MNPYLIIALRNDPLTLADLGRLVLSFELNHFFNGPEVPRDTPIELWYTEDRQLGIFAGDTSDLSESGWKQAI